MKEFAHPVIRTASTVNYHLLEACNMSCGFCFATFSDIPKEYGLMRDEALAVVDALCEASFRKINFAGGEPTLRRWLPELILRAKRYGVMTSIVSNGSRIGDAAGAVEDFPSASGGGTERRAHRRDDRIG